MPLQELCVTLSHPLSSPSGSEGAVLVPGPEWLWVGLLSRAEAAPSGGQCWVGWLAGWQGLGGPGCGLGERCAAWVGGLCPGSGKSSGQRGLIMPIISCGANGPASVGSPMLWNGATFAGTPTLWEGASSVGTQPYQLTWNLGVGMGVAPGHGASLFTQSLALISVVQRPPDLWGQADRVRGLSRLPPPYIPESGVVAAPSSLLQ